MKNLSFDQLHRKYICSDHFDTSSYTDSTKTKLRRDANPIPYNPKQNRTENPTVEKQVKSEKIPEKISEKLEDAQSQKTKDNLTDLLRCCKTGYNPQLFAQLKSKATTMSETEKYCNLIFDEMTIEGRLEYSEILDEIEGFEDFGHFGRLSDIANEIMVFMLQGIYSDWRTPIAYFVSSSGIKTYLLSKIIGETVKKVVETGLNLVSIVSDQGHNNFPATRRLGVATETPYFDVNSKRIYAIFDVPNLFKSIKNNFIGADLSYKNNRVSFRDVIATYNIDKVEERKLKLTDSHVNPTCEEKFEISLALETLSNTVGTCMKLYANDGRLAPSVTAVNTAEFLIDLNDLFDNLNTEIKPEVVPELIRSKNTLEKLVKLTEFGPKVPRSFSGLVQTINAILRIYGEVENAGFSYLLTSKFNLDPLQDFFKLFAANNSVRTVANFREYFREVCADNLAILPKFNVNQCNKNLRIQNKFIETQFLEEDPSDLYLTAYLAKFASENLNCDRCHKLLRTDDLLEVKSDLSQLFRAFGLGETACRGLHHPSSIFLKFIERGSKIFKKVFNDKLRKTKLSGYIQKEIVDVLSYSIDMEPCKGHLEWITKEFVIRKLHWECSMQNRNR